MSQSESIQKLMVALGEFQAMHLKIRKESNNPYFKSKYASLPGILDEVQPKLNELKLVITQMPQGDKLITMLYHTESAEYITSEFVLAGMTTPQAIGSAMTYARRYSLTAILNLNIDDDDDGNAASAPPFQPKNKNNNATQQNAAAPAPNNNQGQQPSQPPATPFNKKYTDVAVIETVLKTATKITEISELFYTNKDLVNGYKPLFDKFAAAKSVIENQGKVIITDKQFSQVCERIKNGDIATYGNALRAFILNDGQKTELKKLDETLKAFETSLRIQYTKTEDIETLVQRCTNIGQVRALHERNHELVDKTPQLQTLFNGKLKTFNAG